MVPAELTVVLFATPQEEIYMYPLEFKVVLFATPPSKMYIESSLKVIPVLT